MATAGVRIDVWLWSVRVYRTRTVAKDACRSGKVRLDGVPAKPAQKVRAGDVVVARRGQDRLTYRVVQPISKRVGAAAASECFEDLTPAEDLAPSVSSPNVPVAAERLRGEGRPTKRDRRRISKFTGR
ncbi:MAG: RNA-binding S4 domain-containing protein [Actinobacteria bacterium]|nr:RNA-binding S4 domain-containing protein [Actinomycetota bacterium]